MIDMSEDKEKVEQDNHEWSQILDLKNEVADAYINKIKDGWFSFWWLLIWKGDMLKNYLVSEDILDKIADDAKWKFLFQPFIKPLLSESIEYNWKTITIWEYLEEAKKELNHASTEVELHHLKNKIQNKLESDSKKNDEVQPQNQDQSTVNSSQQNNTWIPYKEASIVTAWLVVGKDVVSALPEKGTKITSPYWVDRGDHTHGGIDYWAKKWTPIYSMVEGTVDRVLYEKWWFGNYVVIKDNEWREIIYAHLKEKPDLQPGQKIAMWEEIWKVWNTWKSTWPHLHFEIREDWKSIDPKTVFPDEVLLA